MGTITLTATDGSTVQFIDESIGSGAMKDVYFSPDKSYVVGFFRKPLDVQGKERLDNITGMYRKQIFGQVGGDYWKNLFCWPEKLVEWNGKIGVVCPTYQAHFFFDSGKFKGKEKEGKWFASAKLRKAQQAVQAIFTFVSSWNNYFIPALILHKDKIKTLPVLIAQLRSADFLKFDMGQVYMMIAFSIFPVIVVYLILSRYIVAGVALGGVKE